MEIIPHKQAQTSGAKRYFTGKPCKHGHITERFTSSFGCIKCHYNSQYRRDKKYRNNHKIEIKKKKATYYQKHKKQIAKKQVIWQRNNRDKTHASNKRYRNRHPNKGKECSARHRSIKKQACPKWINPNELKQIYRNCPKGYEVDHIVPLTSKIVCGLHVPWNLQFLLVAKNRAKGNKFPYVLER